MLQARCLGETVTAEVPLAVSKAGKGGAAVYSVDTTEISAENGVKITLENKTKEKWRCLQWFWCKLRQVQGCCRTWQSCSAHGGGRGGWCVTIGREFYPCQIGQSGVWKRTFVTLVSLACQWSSFHKEDLYTWFFGAVSSLSFLLAAVKTVDWCTRLFLPSLQKLLASSPLILLCNWISAISYFC